MSDDKFCLKWNDFESNIKTSFGDLRESKVLFDMTLVCGEFQQIQAHKVILSASSPFFREVLCQNPHTNPHPHIYLRGINQTDLQHILDFIYHGEVNVAQDNLNSFLAVAEDLKIKGLTQSQNESKPSSSSSSTNNKHRKTNSQPTKVYQSRASVKEDDEVQEIPVGVKNEVTEDVVQDHRVALEQEYSNQGYGADLMEANYEGDGAYDEVEAGLQLQDYGAGSDKGNTEEYLDAMISTKMIKIMGGWRCVECHREYKQKGDLSRHVEASHIDHPGCQCLICGKICKTRDSLRNHMYQAHRH